MKQKRLIVDLTLALTLLFNVTQIANLTKAKYVSTYEVKCDYLHFVVTGPTDKKICIRFRGLWSSHLNTYMSENVQEPLFL